MHRENNAQDAHPIFNPLSNVISIDFAARQQHPKCACQLLRTVMHRRHMAMFAVAMALVLCLSARLDSGQVDAPVSLFQADTFPTGWKYFSAENGSKLQDVWQTVKSADGDDVLICRGKPFGYIRTQKLHRDFEFRIEWMYPKDANGNSGVLIHTGKEDKIWPNSIQVQLHGPTAGSIFPSGETKTDNKLMVRDLSKPVGQWNTCVITSKAGTISVVINGKKSGEVSGCLPKSGSISLQSEGSEIHFRRVMLKPLK